MKSPATDTLRLRAELGPNPGLSLRLPTWVVTAARACCQRDHAKRPHPGVQLPCPPWGSQNSGHHGASRHNHPPWATSSSPGVSPPGEKAWASKDWLAPYTAHTPEEGAPRGGLAESRSQPPAERDPDTRPSLASSPSPHPGRHPKAGDGKGREEGPRPSARGRAPACPGDSRERRPRPRQDARRWGRCSLRPGRMWLQTHSFGGRWVCQPSGDTRSHGEEWPLGPAVLGLCTCGFLTSEVGTVHGSVYR